MPTVTIGANTTDTYSGAIDCQLHLPEPTMNVNSTSVQLTTPTDWESAGLLAFTGLSNITGPVTVSAATLYLYKNQESPSFYNPTAYCRRVLRNWVENQATWNVYSTGNSWTTAGAKGDGTDRVATATTLSGLGSALNQYHAQAISTADVEGWINGTFSNYGWLINIVESTDQFWKFVSNTGTDGQRPYLSVTYEAATGSPVALFMAHYS